jgi:putative glycerol-1-phosphate prenyltransferase
MFEYKEWKHVFKLDPNKEINTEDLEKLCESGTDAIIIGGTDDVTFDNTINLLARVRKYAVPCVLEISSLEAITPGFDYYFVPTVLNSSKAEWIVGFQHTALKEYGSFINWDELVTEGYCILNKDSKVAHLTDANTDLSEEDVEAYATLADKLFHLPIFYIEYSGEFGDMELVKSAKNSLQNTLLYYGGGISSEAEAAKAARYADTVVVGNIIYEDIGKALQTVKSVKDN